MKNLPIGIQTFSKLIEGDYLYIDKTQLISDLISEGGGYFFLSRPRRFGKSLLITTLAEIFKGKKELFTGLWIYDKIGWDSYPVIHMDFSTIDYESPDRLKESIKRFLDDTASSFGMALDKKGSFKENFVELIKKLGSEKGVVILIDEYDKPLIDFLESGKIDTAKEIRLVLKNFYSAIKGSDAYLRFVFITGVSKFSKVSVFSDLNNLMDITLSEKYSTLLGYTEIELLNYFSPYMDVMKEKLGIDGGALREKIREWYNGYSWDGENFVYNPFSILNLFNVKGFENFWFSTGTPGFLIDLVKPMQSEVIEFENMGVQSYIFDTFDFDNLEIAALLFQTGYLTIKKIIINENTLSKTFYLSYPNREVRQSFLSHLFGTVTEKDLRTSSRILEKVNRYVERDDIDGFIREIESLFASIPYQIFIENKEAYYHTVIYLLLRLNGGVVKCEEATNTGRIDGVLETKNKIYIMEFKMGKALEAMDQIKRKKYFEKYLGMGKEIILIGIGFSEEKRNVGDYLVETMSV